MDQAIRKLDRGPWLRSLQLLFHRYAQPQLLHLVQKNTELGYR